MAAHQLIGFLAKYENANLRCLRALGKGYCPANGLNGTVNKLI